MNRHTFARSAHGAKRAALRAAQSVRRMRTRMVAACGVRRVRTRMVAARGVRRTRTRMEAARGVRRTRTRMGSGAQRAPHVHAHGGGARTLQGRDSSP